jgi:hypothetical protein
MTSNPIDRVGDLSTGYGIVSLIIIAWAVSAMIASLVALGFYALRRHDRRRRHHHPW